MDKKMGYGLSLVLLMLGASLLGFSLASPRAQIWALTWIRKLDFTLNIVNPTFQNVRLIDEGGNTITSRKVGERIYIAGRLVDGSGNPIPNWYVHAYLMLASGPEQEGNKYLWTYTTDSAGNFARSDSYIIVETNGLKNPAYTDSSYPQANYPWVGDPSGKTFKFFVDVEPTPGDKSTYRYSPILSVSITISVPNPTFALKINGKDVVSGQTITTVSPLTIEVIPLTNEQYIQSIKISWEGPSSGNRVMSKSGSKYTVSIELPEGRYRMWGEVTKTDGVVYRPPELSWIWDGKSITPEPGQRTWDPWLLIGTVLIGIGVVGFAVTWRREGPPELPGIPIG
ncbi:MAG: hypothetical protein QXN33_00185 [Candidatus Bathyarchaeia archaeon]